MTEQTKTLETLRWMLVEIEQRTTDMPNPEECERALAQAIEMVSRVETLETEAKLLREAVDCIQAALDDENLDVFDQVEVIRELLPTIDGQPASPEQGKENPNG